MGHHQQLQLDEQLACELGTWTLLPQQPQVQPNVLGVRAALAGWDAVGCLEEVAASVRGLQDI